MHVSLYTRAYLLQRKILRFSSKRLKNSRKKVEKLLDNIIDIAQVLKLFNLFRRAAIEDIYPDCTFYFGN